MKYYFTLQYKMLNRQLAEFGIQPAIAYVLCILIFGILSQYLFTKASYIPYVYGLIPLFLAIQLSEPKRNDFLKSCFSKSRYTKLRLVENLLTTLPFLIFLLYKQQWLIVPSVLILSALLSFYSLSSQYSFTLPTPFYKKPFEFTIGFRKSIILIIAAYCLGIIAMLIGNFNLGLFSLATLLGICASFYLTPEESFYVWIHSLDVKSFIWSKTKILLLYTTILSVPLTLALAIFFFDKIALIIALQCLGYLYIWTVLLSKYANFPDQLIIPEIIVLGLCLVFPPLLLVITPYFYIKSQKRLKEILA